MKTQTNKNQFIDPVCHMKVTRSSAVPSFDFGDDTYYFCAEGCRKTFMADPTRYLGSDTPNKKGLWGRYLERLNKLTGGKPQCCH
jgi:YHS domain-containing protein